jgi:hypothetical protein
MREPYSFILTPSIQIDNDITVSVQWQGSVHGGRAVLIDFRDANERPFLHMSLSVQAAQQLAAGLQESERTWELGLTLPE